MKENAHIYQRCSKTVLKIGDGFDSDKTTLDQAIASFI